MFPRLYEPGGEKLGMFQVKLLLMPKDRPMYGLEIAAELEKSSGWRPSPGTLYPALKKLEEKGFISFEKVTSSGNKRKLYSLTEKGEGELAKIFSLTCYYYDCKLRDCLKDFYRKAVELAGLGKDDQVLVSPPDPDLLDMCSGKVDGRVLAHPFISGLSRKEKVEYVDVEELPEESLDKVILNLGSSSSHDDMWAIIKSAYQKLKTEGVLVSLAPEKSDNIWVESFYRHVLGTTDYGIDPEELEGVLLERGFRKLKVSADREIILTRCVK